MTEPTQPIQPTQSAARRSGRWIYLLGILGFLAYAAWILGPYLRSIIVRDAAVTTWLNWSASPIAGTIERLPVAVGQSIGPDGVIARIENPHLSRHVAEEHAIRIDLARARVRELEAFLEEIQLLDRERSDLKSQYADTFRAQLSAEIASLERKIKVYANRLDLMRKIAARKTTLAGKGLVSEIVADEDAIRVSDLEFDLAELRERLDQSRIRRKAADGGVFIDSNGEDPAWVRGSRMELKLEKKRARLELRQAQAELSKAETDVEAAQEDLERLSEATVRAPPGSIVWSEPVARGAAVASGQTVATWLDCSVLMIDVPLADAEVSLIKPGMAAEVILEGETETRRADVLLTRGSGSTLGKEDLAAVAKGRRDGVAQVLLDFSRESGNFEECPVGRAAYVDFLDIGLIEVIRARLRL
jgi:multidrug resistance efflux pump